MEKIVDTWEVMCQVCYAGFKMSDEEVKRRLDSSRAGNKEEWPDHCGKCMMIRKPYIQPPRNYRCSHLGCWYATNATCSCDCGGKLHGIRNDNPHYSQVRLAKKPWYKQPISEYITLEDKKQ